jgi:hypothetical protein
MPNSPMRYVFSDTEEQFIREGGKRRNGIGIGMRSRMGIWMLREGAEWNGMSPAGATPTSRPKPGRNLRRQKGHEIQKTPEE